ncbi:MAG: thioredoxin domain-containing protein [Desulfuromonadaceae bacterium]|nr:thioredoxin domain-containing protein [Desulfuromonadaceae bacterium]
MNREFRVCSGTIGLLLLLTALILPSCCLAFGAQGCGAGQCRDCHQLTQQEALSLLPPGADTIHRISLSEVGGLWRVEGEAQGKRFTVYLDFSKRYLIAGTIVRLRDGVDLSRQVACDQVPRDTRLWLGRSDATVVVDLFSDVQCSHCASLHQLLPKVVAALPQVAFRIHLLPLFMDRELAAELMDTGHLDRLDQAYRGDVGLSKAAETRSLATVEAVEQFARNWQLRSTPFLILPDGQVVVGGRSEGDLLRLLQPYVEPQPVMGR